MSREIEQFYKDWPVEQYGNIGRWIDPPPGIQCPICKADMFLLPNGVTYSCSECKYMEQKRNSHIPLKFSRDK